MVLTSSFARGALALLAAAAVTGTMAEPAQAQNCSHGITKPAVPGCPSYPLQTGAFVSGLVGLLPAVIGILPFFGAGAKWDLRAAGRNRGVETYWYVTGSAAFALGGAAIALQAFSSAPCGSSSDCRMVYGLGGGALGGGALLLGFAIYESSLPPPMRQAWIVPTPLLLPTEHGLAAGVGFAGRNF
jgi:hypothetical protein